MQYKNRGVWAILEREISLVLVCEKEIKLDADLQGIVYMTDPSGQSLGEYLFPERREQVMREHPNSFFMSEDFVMYADRNPKGDPFFLPDEMSIRNLDGIEGITNATSGSMTTLLMMWSASFSISPGRGRGRTWCGVRFGFMMLSSLSIGHASA